MVIRIDAPRTPLADTPAPSGKLRSPANDGRFFWIPSDKE
jgi:hypothetical protein